MASSPKSPEQRSKSNQNFIGVPPNNETESTHQRDGNFEDEDEELENCRNNLVTQAQLFRNYIESNSLYVN